MPRKIPVGPNLPLLLAQAREQIVSRFRPIMKHFGVTEQQWRILRVLYQQGPMEPRQICETCLFLSPSIAGVLARMETMRLVRKEPHETDLRRLYVHLTDHGRALVEAALPLVDEQYRLIDGAIEKKERYALCEMLERIIALNGTAIPLVNVEHVEVPRNTGRRAAASGGRSGQAGRITRGARAARSKGRRN